MGATSMNWGNNHYGIQRAADGPEPAPNTSAGFWASAAGSCNERISELCQRSHQREKAGATVFKGFALLGDCAGKQSPHRIGSVEK